MAKTEIRVTAEQRLQLFADAITAGIHAHQSRLRELTARGDAKAFAFPGTVADRDAAATAFSQLAKASNKAVLDWIERGDASDTPIPDLAPFTTVAACITRLTSLPLTYSPKLPLIQVMEALRKLAPAASPQHLCAVASLYQVILQVSLDGEELQGLFRLYLALKLPVSLFDLGIDDSDPNLVAMGKRFAKACCACPFDTTAKDWHLAGHKLKFFAEKLQGRITAATYARELLKAPEVRECMAAIRSLPPQRVVILGHSFTMSMHWASHGSFTDIAGHIVRHFNPGIEWVHVGRGGLTPTIARKSLLERVLQHRPDQTILVTISRTAEDRADLKYCIERLLNQGSKVIVFDCIMVYPEIYETEKPAVVVARKAGATVIEVYPLLNTHPQRAEFPAMDVVHTAPPYHKFMAVELVRFFAGKRPATLPAAKV